MASLKNKYRSTNLVTSRRGAIEFLFEILGSSKPRKRVHASVVKLVSGMSLSTIWGKMEGADSPLVETFCDMSGTISCGTALLDLMTTLVQEAAADPAGPISQTRMIELMVTRHKSPRSKSRRSMAAAISLVQPNYPRAGRCSCALSSRR